MVTLNQLVLAGIATQKRLEKEGKRRIREVERRYKELKKQEDIQNATEAVASYQAYIETITGVHKKCSNQID